MNSREPGVQKTSAWWAAGIVMLTAALTLWSAPLDVLAETLQNQSYSYDNEGNVAALTDPLNANQTFGYDELDRLSSATGPYGSGGATQTHTYANDQIGNLTSATCSGTPCVLLGSYIYPSSGPTSVRPHAVSTAGANSYSYDDNGNLTGGAGRTLTYNLENKPTSITSGGQTTTFVYDGDGGRVKKIVGATTIRYISKLYECDNAACSRFIFAGSQRIAVVPNSGGVYYYHADHLGSSSVITDSTGIKVQALTYYPYGAVRTNVPGTPVDVPYKYTGKELDSSTGLYFYEARYYDPVLGRFISADTLVPRPNDPQEFNRYTYAGNNPLLYTDPTGHFSFNIGKFFRRAFGDVGTTLVGVGVGFFTGCYTCGAAIMTQSESGRYALSGAIVVGTIVAAGVCTAGTAGGCAPLAGAAVGSTLGAGFGGYSAARNGGDLSSGILFGAGVGAVTGAIQGHAWTVPFGPEHLPAVSAQTLKFFASHIGATALTGAGSGATVGYGGGSGNWNTIWEGTWHGAAVGAATGLFLAGVDYAGGFPIKAPTVDFPAGPGNPGGTVPIDFSKWLGTISASTVQQLAHSPLVAGLTVSAASGVDVLTRGDLSGLAYKELGEEGAHCSVGTGGFGCGLGTGAE